MGITSADTAKFPMPGVSAQDLTDNRVTQAFSVANLYGCKISKGGNPLVHREMQAFLVACAGHDLPRVCRDGNPAKFPHTIYEFLAIDQSVLPQSSHSVSSTPYTSMWPESVEISTPLSTTREGYSLKFVKGAAGIQAVVFSDANTSSPFEGSV